MKRNADALLTGSLAVPPEPDERRFEYLVGHEARSGFPSRVAFVVNEAIGAIQIATGGDFQNKLGDGGNSPGGLRRVCFCSHNPHHRLITYLANT